MKDYIAPKWHGVLEEAGLCDFSSLWDLDLKFIEEPNSGRGQKGWSGVSFLTVSRPDGTDAKLVLKRQFNHNVRTLRHPLSGIPTFQREFENVLRYKKLGIPAQEAVFFARRNVSGGVQAILVSEFLTGYRSLDELIIEWEKEEWPDMAERCRIIEAVANLVRKLHKSGVCHNCLYPKHLFVADVDGKYDARFIDLEKSRRQRPGSGGGIRDLDSLHRRTASVSYADRMRFLTAYCRADWTDETVRSLERKIVERGRRKRSGKAS